MYFWNRTLHVSDSISVHNQKSSTVHTAMVYVIQVMLLLASGIRMELDSYPKNKFEKLVLLVGFIIRIYHDAWSSECRPCVFNLRRSQVKNKGKICLVPPQRLEYISILYLPLLKSPAKKTISR